MICGGTGGMCPITYKEPTISSNSVAYDETGDPLIVTVAIYCNLVARLNNLSVGHSYRQNC